MTYQQRSCLVPLLLLCITSLLFSVALTNDVDEYVDNFKVEGTNNLGGVRRIIHARDLTQLGRLWDQSNGTPVIHNGLILCRPQHYLIEMLTSKNNVKDLSNKSLGIYYSGANRGTFTVKLFQRNPHGGCTMSFDYQAVFKSGRNYLDIPMSDFKGADLTLAQGFAFEGPATFYYLKLCAHPNTADSSTDAVNDVTINPIVFDLRQNIIASTKDGDGWFFNPGVGYHIFKESSGLTVSLPRNAAKFMKIQYTAKYLGTRLLTFYHDSDHGSRFGETFMHVVFNHGQNKELVIPLPSRKNPRLSISAVNVRGHLTLHQFELVNTAPEIEISEGESTPDALLIDDFSYWRNDHFNNLDYSRFFSGDMLPSYMNLNGEQGFLVEFFRDAAESRDLSSMAFRITYTVDTEVTCELTLVSRKSNHMDKKNEVKFPSGTETLITIPISKLVGLQKLDLKSPYVALQIRGPDDDFITLRRIEIMSVIPYKLPLQA